MSSGAKKLSPTHELKCWTGPFAEVMAGRKRHEIRKDDRGFQLGDTVCLIEWDEHAGCATGRRAYFTIGHVSHGWGLPNDLCVFTLLEEKESGRWASRLNFVHREYDVDGSGTESGDSLDVIEAEVRGALLKMRERAESAEAELARLWSVVEAAKAQANKAASVMNHRGGPLSADHDFMGFVCATNEAVDALRADETKGGPQWK